MGHGFHGYVTNNQRVTWFNHWPWGFSWKWSNGMCHITQMTTEQLLVSMTCLSNENSDDTIKNDVLTIENDDLILDIICNGDWPWNIEVGAGFTPQNRGILAVLVGCIHTVWLYCQLCWFCLNPNVEASFWWLNWQLNQHFWLLQSWVLVDVYDPCWSNSSFLVCEIRFFSGSHPPISRRKNSSLPVGLRKLLELLRQSWRPLWTPGSPRPRVFGSTQCKVCEDKFPNLEGPDVCPICARTFDSFNPQFTMKCWLFADYIPILSRLNSQSRPKIHQFSREILPPHIFLLSLQVLLWLFASGGQVHARWRLGWGSPDAGVGGWEVGKFEVPKNMGRLCLELRKTKDGLW